MTEKILPILTAIFGGGWIAQVLFMKYEKRKKASEAKGAEIDIDEKEDRLRDKKLSDAYDQIEKLQAIINSERDKWIKLAEEASAIKQELIREKEARQLAEVDKCTISGCPNRQPPRTESNG